MRNKNGLAYVFRSVYHPLKVFLEVGYHRFLIGRLSPVVRIAKQIFSQHIAVRAQEIDDGGHICEVVAIKCSQEFVFKEPIAAV